MIKGALLTLYTIDNCSIWHILRHGYGLLQRKLNSKRVRYTPIYDGEWKFDKKDGDGTAYYENGFYEGQWTHGCRNGLGIMTFYDGSYYIGQWKNDLYDGIGAHYGVWNISNNWLILQIVTPI